MLAAWALSGWVGVGGPSGELSFDYFLFVFASLFCLPVLLSYLCLLVSALDFPGWLLTVALDSRRFVFESFFLFWSASCLGFISCNRSFLISCLGDYVCLVRS